MIETIDVLMATYNGEKYIKEQLDSILSQTYSNFNLIISDDCSTDNTNKILDEYQKKDERIKVFKQQKNLGYRKNFEFLCKNSNSKYVMFSDQDDVWKNDKIEKMLNYIKNENCNLVYCDLEIVDKNLNRINESIIDFFDVRHNTKYTDFRSINMDNVVTGCAMIVKREVLDKCYPFPEKIYPHDWWIALIACQDGKIKFLDEKLLKYRQHDNNTIGANNTRNANFDEYRKKIIDFQLEHFEYCLKNKNKFNEDYNKRVDKSYDYFKKLSDNDIIKEKLKNFNYVFFGYKCDYKIKKYLLFHHKKISKILFNIRKGVRK